MPAYTPEELEAARRNIGGSPTVTLPTQVISAPVAAPMLPPQDPVTSLPPEQQAAYKAAEDVRERWKTSPTLMDYLKPMGNPLGVPLAARALGIDGGGKPGGTVSETGGQLRPLTSPKQPAQDSNVAASPAPVVAGTSAPVGAPVQYTPARTVTGFNDKLVPVREQTRKELLSDYDSLKKDEMALAKIDANHQVAMQGVYDWQKSEAEKFAAGRAVRQAEQQAQLRDLVGKREALMGELQKKPEAFQYVGSGDDAAKVVFSIMAALMGPKGLALVNAEADRQFAREKQAYEQYQSGINNRKGLTQEALKAQDGLIAQHRAMFEDADLADKAAEIASTERMKLSILQAAARAGTDQAMANGQKAADILELKKDGLQREFDGLAHYKVTVGGGPARTPIKTDPNIVRLPNGKSIRFPTEKAADAARDRLTATYNVVQMYDKASALRKRRDELNPVTSPAEYYKLYAELDALAERAIPEWSVGAGQGQVKEGEYGRYKKKLFPFAASVDPAAERIIAQGRQTEIDRLENLVRASGGEYVNEGYALDQRGNVQATEALAGEHPEGKRIAIPAGAKKVGE